MGGLLKRDKFALCIAGMGLVLWYVTREPLVALLLAILIDATGATLTIIKSYEHPTTEPIVAWVLTGLGGFFAIFAVENWNWVLLLFPLYTLLANAMIVTSIKLGENARGYRL